MPKPQTLEICKKYLFENPEKELSKQMHERLLRIRSGYIHWAEFPMKSESDIRYLLMREHDVKKTQAYQDIEIIKALLGNIKSAGKDWHRYKFNAGFEEAWTVATTKQDPKAMAMLLREYGKNNQLHIPDSQSIPWEDIIPQLIEPTEDPTVVGLQRIPNVREMAKKLLDKYTSEIAENVTSVTVDDIDHEDIEEDESAG